MDTHLQTESRHIVLVGLPGSGKSAAGILAARQLGRPFFDADAMSETPTTHHIPDDERSDVVVRAERDWFERMVGLAGRSIIVAPCSAIDDVVENDRDGLWIVLLEVSLDTSKKRLIHDGLDPADADALDQFAARHAAGLAEIRAIADVTIDTDALTIDEVVEMIDAQSNEAPRRRRRS